MSENLERQYDEVVNYINGYRLFQSRVTNRLNPIHAPIRSLKLIGQFPRLLMEMNPLSGRSSQFEKTAIADYATEEEKATDYFEVAVSDYSIDTLSTSLQKTFNGVDFVKLTKIHNTKKARLARLNVRQVTGIVLAAGTLMLRSVPKQVAEGTFRMPYATFETNVFWITILLTGYMLLIMLPAWIKIFRARTVYRYVGYVLEYTAIKYEKVKLNPEA